MTATAVHKTGAPASVRSRPALAWGLVAAGVALVAVALLSIAVGAKSIPLGTAVDALLHYDGRLDDHVVVRDLRLPRTLLGLVVGAALGLAGALIQALTRNPLADPGILGINEGAGLGVLVAVGIAGLTSPWAYVWFAFAGAAASAAIVYAIGARGREGANPVRLVLAGIAFTYVLHAIGRAILLTDTATFDRWRNWMIGSLASADPGVIVGILPFVAAGAVIGVALTPSLNALALGEEAGQALGVHRGQTRVLGAVAVTLLCGSATAAAGPIAFVGLMVPYAARMITGPDYRWLVPYSLVLAPILLLASDVLGRVVTRPSEIGVGVVTAVLGAPLLIALVRRRGRLPRL